MSDSLKRVISVPGPTEKAKFNEKRERGRELNASPTVAILILPNQLVKVELRVIRVTLVTGHFFTVSFEAAEITTFALH